MLRIRLRVNLGPIDPSVLYEQEQHISSAIWEGQDRGTLRCHEHTSNIDGWKLLKKQIDLVGKAGWLKENLSECPNDASDEEMEQHARAFLLYWVGSTIFATTSGNLVPLLYLPLFKDFDKAGKYAWGAAALAFLYRQLGKASMKCQEYHQWLFDVTTELKQELSHHFPLAFHWKGKLNNQAKLDITLYRQKLDSFELIDIDWTPYDNLDSCIPEDIRSDFILGRSRTILICMDGAEWHLPDRCLRQFGLYDSEYAQVVAEMIKIQELAYAASTEGMNSKNRVAFDKNKATVDKFKIGLKVSRHQRNSRRLRNRRELAKKISAIEEVLTSCCAHCVQFQLSMIHAFCLIVYDIQTGRTISKKSVKKLLMLESIIESKQGIYVFLFPVMSERIYV
ncbi:hypothetical protein EZV62_003472 [Acer yangbiense]|uniref:Aminotransferase-like plant mobile domain-containing protein n=1 Tax=Acer yangbiense TaxID=1000413 RepID=A0A5C7IGU8_9ROSI|nr:hypothetical protein EZV62_003472 [Acer yangbiense]